MINNERADVWTKKSWLDEFVASPHFAKDLTSTYAEDILHGLEDKSYGSLDEAIATLKDQVGLTVAEVSDIKRVVVAATDPESFIAEENIRKAKKSDLAELLKLATTVCEECKEAPCVCSKTLASPIAKAINRIGLETLAEMCDKAEIDGQPATDTAEEKEEVEKLEDATAAVELTKEADRVKALIAEGSTVAEAMEKAAKGMNPGFQAYLDNKKKEGEGGKASDEEPTEKKDEKDKKADKAAAATGKTVKAEDRAKDKAEHEKVEGELKKVEKEVEAHEAREAEAALKSKAERWAEALKAVGYFQGAEEASVEGDITSNDPKKLGYPKDVKYDRKPMAVPVGEDSRPWEQTWFEGAATETKKVMGPSGEEEKLKKELLRATYLFKARKLANAKKN